MPRAMLSRPLDDAESALQSQRLVGLAPVVSPDTVVLVLGSFPGAASLRAGQYYAHPQNQFWRMLQTLWPDKPIPPPDAYDLRCAWLLRRGLGLWDVYASCERQGSLDAAIRQAQVNDFGQLARYCPRVKAVAHNGAESHKHAHEVLAAWACCGSDGAAVPESVKLPSTSPANASWSFDRKRAAWAALMAGHGLL